MKVRSIKANAILNIIYTITNMMFPLITFPYVSRVLSAGGMGKVSFFSSFSNYAIMVASLGISTYGIRAVAKVRDDEEKLNKVTKELLILNTIATVIVIGLIILSVPFVGKFRGEPFVLAVNIALIFSASIGMEWLYAGLEQYDYITKRSILFKAVALVLVFAFVKKASDYWIYAAITVFSTGGSYVCNFIHARKYVHVFKKSGPLQLRVHLKPMLLLFASILAVSIYTNLDTVMLGFIRGDEEVGLYTVAVKVKWILLSGVNAISAVLLPRLSYYLSENKEEEYHGALKKSVSVICMIAIPLTVYFLMEAKDSILLLGGDDYLGAVRCMQIVMPILLISGFSNITGNQVLIPLGKDACFMRAVAVGAVIDLLLNAALMPKYGCVGAAIATLLAELVQMSIQLFYARKYILKNIRYSTVMKSFLACVPGSIIIFIVPFSFSAFGNLAITAISFFFLYCLMLLVMKESTIMDVFKQIREKK